MTVSDWRLLPAQAAADLYRRERVRWKRRLSWDTAPTWHTVETARVTWGLPGLVCHDAFGRVRGWAFYLIRQDAIEVGGFVAEDEAASVALVDALLEKGHRSHRLTGFVYAHAPGLEDALRARAVLARPFLYLVHDLEHVTRDSADRRLELTAWPGHSPEAAARLLQRAYGAAGRMFAPNNAPHEWQQYVTNLLRDPALGSFSPTLSRVAQGEERPCALAIVTLISRRTAHLAQIAVDPSLRRQGVAQQVMCDVLASARQEGFSRVSLLVAGDNTAARALYNRLGFTPRESFVAFGGHGHGVATV